MERELIKSVVELLKAIEENTEYCYIEDKAENRDIIITQYIADEIEEIKSVFKRYSYISEQFEEIKELNNID